ncbi:MAG: hypothetical protein FJY77_04220 [Candidatus Altiarchaeales archaeon]|nr:hypothetical protein [Candidatus Altiarchaeales archaeon]
MSNPTSRIFMGTAYLIEKFLPNIRLRLKQAYINEDPVSYIAKTVLYSTVCFITLSFVIAYIFAASGSSKTYIGPVLALLASLFMFYYYINTPKMVVAKRVKDIEKNLAFAIQSLYVQVSSGVPVFNAMSSIADGKYGKISEEFKITVNEVKSGKPVINAIEDMAMRNPSLFFQRVMWQIVNTMKTGGDLAGNLDDLVKLISREQVNAIKTYGGRLSPIAMAYMMVAVIVPSLGVTVLITLSSLPGISSKFGTNVFWGILILTIILQLQFAMIIRSMRPNLVGE